MGDVCLVSVVCMVTIISSVVRIRIAMVIDWLNINLVRVVMLVMVIMMVVMMVVIVNFMMNWSIVVSWLCYMRS